MIINISYSREHSFFLDAHLTRICYYCFRTRCHLYETEQRPITEEVVSGAGIEEDQKPAADPSTTFDRGCEAGPVGAEVAEGEGIKMAVFATVFRFRVEFVDIFTPPERCESIISIILVILFIIVLILFSSFSPFLRARAFIVSIPVTVVALDMGIQTPILSSYEL